MESAGGPRRRRPVFVQFTFRYGGGTCADGGWRLDASLICFRPFPGTPTVDRENTCGYTQSCAISRVFAQYEMMFSYYAAPVASGLRLYLIARFVRGALPATG